MSRRDTAVALRDMLDYTREAVSMGHNRSRADFDTDRQFNLALVRLLEIIGEAAGRVSAEEQLRYPEIKSKQIIGLRNSLIHA